MAKGDGEVKAASQFSIFHPRRARDSPLPPHLGVDTLLISAAGSRPESPVRFNHALLVVLPAVAVGNQGGSGR